MITATDVKRAWDRYWFAPQGPFDLAVCRLLFFGLCFWHVLPREVVGYDALPDSLYAPVWLFERLHLPVLPDSVAGPLGIVWKLSLLCSAVGVMTRPTMVTAAALTLYFLALPFNFGKTDHNAAAVALAAGILALSRAGDALSVDAWLRRRGRRGGGLPSTPAAASGHYRWPIRAVWVLMTCVFCAAGLTKLRAGGLDWVFSDHFAILLAQRHYAGTPPMVDWGLWIAGHPWLCYALAASAILVEVLFPLALVNRWARIVFPASMFAMQLGIGVVMNVWFGAFMYTYVFWVGWSAMLAIARRHGRCAAKTTTPTLPSSALA